MIDVNDTVRSYSGKHGCMCGCQGTYNNSQRARKLALNYILKQDTFQVQDFGSVSKDDTAGCIYFETDTRTRVLYVTGAGIQAALKMRNAEVAA